jgi:GT2 family glycosyltransferase
MVCCRESDKKTINIFKKLKENDSNIIIKTIKHYSITERHNMKKIKTKRNIIRKYALLNGYDNLIFIDSDIVINNNTITKLLNSDSDICIIPYNIKWLGNIVAVGILKENKYEIKIIKENKEKYRRCNIGGMGCTLLNKKAMEIEFEVKKYSHDKKNFAYGEDIGYFLNANKKGLKIKYLSGHKIKHM